MTMTKKPVDKRLGTWEAASKRKHQLTIAFIVSRTSNDSEFVRQRKKKRNARSTCTLSWSWSPLSSLFILTTCLRETFASLWVCEFLGVFKCQWVNMWTHRVCQWWSVVASEALIELSGEKKKQAHHARGWRCREKRSQWRCHRLHRVQGNREEMAPLNERWFFVLSDSVKNTTTQEVRVEEAWSVKDKYKRRKDFLQVLVHENNSRRKRHIKLVNLKFLPVHLFSFFLPHWLSSASK